MTVTSLKVREMLEYKFNVSTVVDISAHRIPQGHSHVMLPPGPSPDSVFTLFFQHFAKGASDSRGSH